MEARLEQLQRFDRWLLSLKPVEMRFLAFSAAIVMDAAVFGLVQLIPYRPVADLSQLWL